MMMENGARNMMMSAKPIPQHHGHNHDIEMKNEE
jgi:hypothetical protein